MTGLKLVEISLVDRSTNQYAIFTLVRFEEGKKRKTLNGWYTFPGILRLSLKLNTWDSSHGT